MQARLGGRITAVQLNYSLYILVQGGRGESTSYKRTPSDQGSFAYIEITTLMLLFTNSCGGRFGQLRLETTYSLMAWHLD